MIKNWSIKITICSVSATFTYNFDVHYTIVDIVTNINIEEYCYIDNNDHYKCENILKNEYQQYKNHWLFWPTSKAALENRKQQHNLSPVVLNPG